MTQDPQKFDELSERLDALLQQQSQLQSELHQLRREMEGLRPGLPTSPRRQGAAPTAEKTSTVTKRSQPEIGIQQEKRPRPTFVWSSKSGLDWEKFIGENLISKIGILITVIGVAFGVKYAIDRELITPLTRISLGYVAGASLLGIALRLKAAYENFSAVLLSGALAILYIITYFAYGYYALFPQGLAFALMVLFTAVTVGAAWQYDRQIIALMGLVGAYGVPYLLSEESGQATILFGYMTIINGGILIIAFGKYWKALFDGAFWLSWLIFSWWMIFGYQSEKHAVTGLIFSAIFFLLFYATTLAYKLSHQEAFKWGDILRLLANAFLYFGFGYLILDDQTGGEDWQGAFALVNAAVHFALAGLIYRIPSADRNLLYFTVGLGITFLTIAVPVQLDGNWVTLLWAAEAALLFWIGRTGSIGAYEKMALPLMLLAFGSLLHDWSVTYSQNFDAGRAGWLRPVLNLQLLSSLLVTGAFGFIVRTQQRFRSRLPAGNLWRQALRFAAPTLLLLILYYAFRLEIAYYWQLQKQLQLTAKPVLSTAELFTFDHLSTVWVVLYSLLFLILLSWANMVRIQDGTLGWVTLALNLFGILAFLVAGLFSLSEMREIFLTDGLARELASSHFYLRYLLYISAAAVLFTTYRCQRLPMIGLHRQWPFDLLLHLTVLWTASSELIHWMDLSGAQDAYKLGLSILWGVYSLFLIALGIAHRKAHLRVGAIVLFAVTLIKLFFYDIVDLSTMAKTVVLVSLGVLLLLSSFLYNKFRDLITEA